MNKKRIFITGGSGCIGHYLTEVFIQETNHELFLLVRNPDKLKIPPSPPLEGGGSRTGVNILQGDLAEIKKFSDLLKTIDVAILAATIWGGEKESYEINVVKNLQLMNLLDAEKCEQVIYFSTASILDRNNKLLKEAGEIGTDYIKSKYECFSQLPQQKIYQKITTVFPTLVLGGDGNKPYSHLSAGLPDVVKWINLARWFQADGSFHFIHARDIAQVVRYLADKPTNTPRELVLGNEGLTVNQAVAQICDYLGKKIYFRLPLSMGLANFFIQVFNVQMAEWDRFCLDYRHFTYENAVNPATFDLTPYAPTLKDVLEKRLKI